MIKKAIILMAVPALLCACDLWANEQLNRQLRSAAAAGDAVRAEHLLERGADIEAADVPLPIAEEFLTGKVERLDFFRGIGLISGETSDESFFIVTPLIGYRPDDDVTLQELIQRAPQATPGPLRTKPCFPTSALIGGQLQFKDILTKEPSKPQPKPAPASPPVLSAGKIHASLKS